ncbi:MAG: recombinase family protein [Mycolicibacter algericus]
MSTSLRVLGRVRLSKDTDETGTSIERQREAIEQWSQMHGHTVIGWAVDAGVSGSVDPFDTPELGPWLQPHRLLEWDALVAYRLDRLARRVIPLNRLFGFVQDHGKTLASVQESLDLSTWIGRLVANVIAGVAEGELEAISERNRGSQKKLREVGRWHGGIPPYGYTAEKRSDGSYLVEAPEEAAVVRDEILPRVLAYESTNSIAEALNSAGVPTRKGTRWSGQVVRTLLRSRSLLGQHEHNGRLVTDSEGLPVQRAEPLVSSEEFRQVQEALEARSVRSGERNQNPLAGVLFCYRCDAPMYSQKMAGREYGYYRCSGRPKCQALSIRADTALGFVEERLLYEIGGVERQERVYTPGSDHSEALAGVRAAIDAARREKDLGLYDGEEDEYLSRLERLVSRRRELEALPAEPAGFRLRGLGETYAQAWQRMTPSERRTLMLDNGIKATMAAGPGNELHSGFHVPEDLRGRLEGGRQ